MNRELVISCEHAGNKIPSQYQHLFEYEQEVLETHRGYDIGALELTNAISDKTHTETHTHSISRLLIDLNRSLDNPALFSEYLAGQGPELQQSIIQEYYLPYRQRVVEAIKTQIAQGSAVLHLSVHTFAPILDGVERNADVGLLYDPGRKSEKTFCHLWRRQLKQHMPHLRYSMNYPYAGTMDGFTTALRKEFTENDYLGIELEVNQRFVGSDRRGQWQEIQDGIAHSLKGALRI